MWRCQLLVLLLWPWRLKAFCSHHPAPISSSLVRPYFTWNSRPWRNQLGAVANNEESSDMNSAKKQTNQTSSTSLTTTTSSKFNDPGILTLMQQAAALRAEADSIEKKLRASQEAKRLKELADIDRWIEECLYVSVSPIIRRNAIRGAATDDVADNDNETTDTATAITTTATRVEMLNSVEQAAQVLRDGRYSHEQVSKMFERISEQTQANTRSNCSPLLALLVDAAGKLDCVDREDNPNKRWDGKVERDLRKRLFAMDWGFQLEPTKNGNDRFL